MGQVREVDAISDAIVETEKEIAGDAWGNEETSALDETGDRGLEAMGEGLEGQHEQDDDASSEEQDAEETDGEAEEGEEGEDEGEEGEEAETAEGKDEPKPEAKTETREQPQGRVPAGKLREEAERRRQAEQLLETERAARAEERKNFEALQTQVQTLTQILQGQRQPPQPPGKEEPKTEPEVPDIFENPRGFVDHIREIVQQAVTPVRSDMKKQAVETSFALAHSTHKDTFANAFQAINKLDPQNPDDRATVQRIYNSPNPGEALVQWHKRSTALSRVGDDPDAYERSIEERTRQSLLKDPEFKKQLLAEMRQEAATGQNGSPRTETRLPPSLARRGGSNLGVERGDHDRHDNSEQAVADAAWR
jgi:hypothetical protein